MSRKGAKRKAAATPRPKVTKSGALAINLSIFFFLLLPWVLTERYPETYYRTIQEDGWIEWMTVWAFLLAAAVYVLIARRERAAGTVPWFSLGVALFAFVVAMEEFSWGQRVLGFRPPDYFLAENFQQELNFHNVIETDVRKLGLKATIALFCILLPIAGALREPREFLERIKVTAPPLAIVPAGIATYWAYESYPWKFSGELVEVMLGLAFLFAAMTVWSGASTRRLDWKVFATSWTIALFLGVATTALTQRRWGDSSEKIQLAKTEAQALAADFQELARLNRGRPITKCGLHKRVFSFVEKYDRDELFEGAFAQLADQGMPEARAEFFIDPWNSPYWIRHECEGRHRLSFVYSFGPNRRRNSTEWELGGDDVGVTVFERGSRSSE